METAVRKSAKGETFTLAQAKLRHRALVKPRRQNNLATPPSTPSRRSSTRCWC
jgi:hypothetical protein